MLLTVQTIAFFHPPRLLELAAEARRVLRKGGVWLLIESNRRSYVAATMEKYYGRPPYSVETAKAALQEGSFQTIDSWYEAFYSPVLAQTVNALRTVFTPGPGDISDFGSRAERLIPAERRGLWVLRVRLVLVRDEGQASRASWKPAFVEPRPGGASALATRSSVAGWRSTSLPAEAAGDP